MFYILILLSFIHSKHENMDCISCHNFENPTPKIETIDKNCLKCHTEKINLTIPNKIEYSTKFKHNTHQFLNCLDCHKKESNLETLGMKKCVGCHKKDECSTCHYYQNGYFNSSVAGKIFIPKNHKKNDFNIKHTVSNEKECLQCHSKMECISCHNAKKRGNSFHPADYISFHKYEKNFTNCNSCHKNGESCNSCHQKSGLDFNQKYSTSFKKNFNIHPDGFKDNHKKEAQKDIQKCLTCHTESSCLSCHKAINPHVKGKNPCRNLEATKKSCIKCHTDGSSRCNR
ncbi:cytochrome c3 family protein [bacterium]|nr:cytochrome c3 family protein [bacterium]